jgi:hypothetical protein
VTLSRKAAKSQTGGRKLRSTGTKARNHVGELPEPRPALEKELEARTQELAEARTLLAQSVEREAATSEVLRVISSSPGELELVFQAMLENATRICAANFGSMLLYEDGSFLRVAHHNVPEAFARDSRSAVRPEEVPTLARLVATREVMHVEDLAVESPHERIAVLGGARTLLIVPLMKEGELIGAIGICLRRPATGRRAPGQRQPVLYGPACEMRPIFYRGSIGLDAGNATSCTARRYLKTGHSNPSTNGASS